MLDTDLDRSTDLEGQATWVSPISPGHSSLSIIVPVYRNAKTLEELYARLCRTLKNRSFEVLFVDDHSPDESWDILTELAAGDPRVGGVRLSHNIGQNRAVMAGLAVARGQTLVVLDADLQDPPEAIPFLVDRLNESLGIEAVFAGRVGFYESPLRLLTSKIFKSFLYIRSAGRLPRDAGLFVALSEPMRNCLLDFSDPDPYVLELMAASRLAMSSIPVRRRRARQSGYSAWDRIQLGIRTFLGPLRRGWYRSSSPSFTDAISEMIGQRFGDREPG